MASGERGGFGGSNPLRNEWMITHTHTHTHAIYIYYRYYNIYLFVKLSTTSCLSIR